MCVYTYIMEEIYNCLHVHDIQWNLSDTDGDRKMLGCRIIENYNILYIFLTLHNCK